MQRQSGTNNRRNTSKNVVRLDEVNSRLNPSQNTAVHGMPNSLVPQISNPGQSRPIIGNFVDPYLTQQPRLQDNSRGPIRPPHTEPGISAGGARNDEDTTFFQGILTPLTPTGTVPVSALANQSSLTHQLLTQKSNPNPSTTAAGSQSRRSSSHSLQNISEPTSDADSDDPDDEDTSAGERGGRSGRASGSGFREKRREAHTQAEQKRRDAIKKGYNELEKELPHDVDKLGNQKDSKARILQKSIEYVNYLETRKKQQAEELEKLKNEFLGLQIMKAFSELWITCSKLMMRGWSLPVSRSYPALLLPG
ncbi:max-like protein X isoform X2 [Paramacrobiotus metropolitanus]|uniref:max-like protein X isoform X2 n=1 Tax=Paramacrobiotus metropolitanus TaxID=2943436 RepID=UPI002445C4B7|nr:max-like protein X isoform X2 [Paramacrobiotus metropolitanus]